MDRPLSATSLPSPTNLRAEYTERMAEIRRAFEEAGDGLATIAARSTLVDTIVTRLWAAEVEKEPALKKGIAVCAIGGYGRSHLFPCSDIDLLFCAEKNEAEAARNAIRLVSQSLWDCGLKVSPMTRKMSECERFSPENAEFGMALLDRRLITGDAATFAKLDEKIRTKMLVKDVKSIRAEIVTLT
ncbi:MAG: bifunctional uridylyltransferase/uridylyl-removing protein, partial [Bryocella sp.]